MQLLIRSKRLTILLIGLLLTGFMSAAQADQNAGVQPTVLVLGDSLSAGFGMDVDQTWAHDTAAGIEHRRCRQVLTDGDYTTVVDQHIRSTFSDGVEHRPALDDNFAQCLLAFGCW